jgi:phosphoribosylanthranilate isomerase
MSTKIKVKVCGMKDSSNILGVSALAPDYMGFIFYKKSPRYVGEEFLLPAGLDPGITKVGVFVNETVEVILEKARRFDFGIVQLHGDETKEQCLALKAEGLSVIKAVSVAGDDDLRLTEKLGDAVDYFLFDTKGKLYGGNASTFDWNVLTRYDQRKPFFLSGGLNAENIDHAVSLGGLNLHAVDVNSGVEKAPGMKDLQKVAQFKDRVSKVFTS